MPFPAYNLSVGEIACMMEKALDLELSCKEIGSVSTCMTSVITKEIGSVSTCMTSVITKEIGSVSTCMTSVIMEDLKKLEEKSV